MTIFLFFLFVIVILFLMGPMVSFNMASLVTMVISIVSLTVYIRKYRKNNLMCFEFFFSIVFFLTTYSYFFLQNSSIGYTVYQALSSISNERSFTFGTLLSALLFQLFLLGGATASRGHSKSIRYQSFKPKKFHETFAAALTLIFLLLFLTDSFSNFMISKQGEVTGGYTYVYWLNMVILLWMSIVFMRNKSRDVNSLFSFIRDNIFFCAITGSLIVVYLISGHRHFGIGLALAAVFLYHHCVREVSARVIIIISIIGFVSMAAVGMIRQNAYTGLSAMGPMGLFRDFLTASLATPFFVEYVDSYGITYGSNYLLHLTAIIPFLSGFIVTLGFKPAPLSYNVFTNTVLEDVYTGLGTSLVGDVYYTFGLVGSAVAFYLLGYIVSWLYRRLIFEGSQSMYELISYVVLMSSSFFMPRNDLLSYLRTVALLCIVYYIMNSLSAQKK